MREELTQEPEDATKWTFIGTLYLAIDDFELAYEYLTKDLSLDPSVPDTWNNLGKYSSRVGNH
jgi:cytochrome c-type biogenesis protein CcmH/NrfG